MQVFMKSSLRTQKFLIRPKEIEKNQILPANKRHKRNLTVNFKNFDLMKVESWILEAWNFRNIFLINKKPVNPQGLLCET